MTNIPVTIRSATVDDVNAVTFLNNTARAKPDGTVGVEYLHTDFMRYVGKPHVVFLVAEGNRRILGFLLAYDHVNWGYVDVLCVRDNWRGSGIGSSLLYMAEEVGKKIGWDFIELCRDEDDTEIGKFIEKRKYIDTGKTRWYAKPLSATAGDGRKEWLTKTTPKP